MTDPEIPTAPTDDPEMSALRRDDGEAAATRTGHEVDADDMFRPSML